MAAELRLCGPPAVVRDGRETPWTASAPRAPLALLACRADWCTRAALLAVLRPDAPEADALGYLRKLVHRARASAAGVHLEIDADRLRWRVPTDVARFRDACDAGDPAALEVPVEDFLAGWRAPNPAFAAWADGERADLLRRRRRLARATAAAREAAGDPAGAAEAAEVLLRDDPLDEPSVADVVRLRLRAGDPAAGLAAYEAFRARLADEVGAEPEAATAALAAQAAAALHAGPGAAAAPAGSPGWLAAAAGPPVLADEGVPVAATRFVGRDAELARLLQALEDGPRVIALVGLGGAGKTRLALEAAARARRRGYEVAFVPLGSGDGDRRDEVAERVAAALPVAWDVVGAEARWGAWAAGGRRLLVLDEAEGAAGLDAWWASAAERLGEVRVWVTSRVAPAWAAASVWPLAGLGLPDPEAGLAAARRASAVRLLLDRAGFDPDAVSDHDVAAAAEVARALGGHPLALALTAAGVRGVPPSVAFVDADRAPRPIRADAADLPDRHRDLDRLLAESWRALPADARRAARRLTLLRRPFDLEAAGAVGGVDAAGLVRLLDRALVQRVGDDRYDVHALVRRSAPPPETDDRDAHARWALHRAAIVGRALKRDGHAAAISALVDLTEDARAGWRHAVDRLARGRTDLLAPLAAALDPLDHAWHTAGRLGLAAHAFGDAVARARPPASGVDPDDERAWRRWWGRTLVRWSVAERLLGRPDAAVRALRRVAASDDVEVALEARLELAKVAMAQGDAKGAERAFRAWVGDPAGRRRPDLASAAHAGLAQILWATAGDVGEALAHDDAAVIEARRDGDPDALIVALINGGAGAFELGHDAEAERCWREAAAIAERIGHRAREAAVWNNLGMLEVRRGRAVAARAAFDRSLALRRAAADVVGQASVLLHLGQLEAARGELAAAATHLETAVAAFDRPGCEESHAMALAAWSELASLDGDARRGAARAQAALAGARAVGSVRATLAALLALARAVRAGGGAAAAGTLARRVAACADGRDAAIHRAAGELADELGAPAAAVAPTDLAALATATLAAGPSASAGWNATGTPAR